QRQIDAPGIESLRSQNVNRDAVAASRVQHTRARPEVPHVERADAMDRALVFELESAQMFQGQRNALVEIVVVAAEGKIGDAIAHRIGGSTLAASECAIEPAAAGRTSVNFDHALTLRPSRRSFASQSSNAIRGGKHDPNVPSAIRRPR